MVLAEHNDEKLNPLTLNAITAAKKLGRDISVLITGANAETIAKEAAKIPDVKTIFFYQDTKLKNQLSGYLKLIYLDLWVLSDYLIFQIYNVNKSVL